MIDIQILESIKDAQMEHGLKYENYQRYASYCSRRLHRLRRSLNVYQKVAPTAKARHQRARKLMDISNAMVLEAGEYGERVILIQLYIAERSWAHSMSLKQQAPEAPRKRFHMIKRLKKASQYAEKFEILCHDEESPCSDRMKEESVAYAAYVKGLYKMECREWDTAKELLSASLRIYFIMSVPIINDEIKEKYKQRIDELRANLKYCLFNMGQKDPVREKLQFHDLAGRHVLAILEQQSKETVEEAPIRGIAESDSGPSRERRESAAYSDSSEDSMASAGSGSSWDKQEEKKEYVESNKESECSVM